MSTGCIGGFAERWWLLVWWWPDARHLHTVFVWSDVSLHRHICWWHHLVECDIEWGTHLLSLFAYLSVLMAIFQNVSTLDFLGAKGDGGGGDNWSYKMFKTPVKSTPPANQHPSAHYVCFYTHCLHHRKGIWHVKKCYCCYVGGASLTRTCIVPAVTTNTSVIFVHSKTLLSWKLAVKVSVVVIGCFVVSFNWCNIHTHHFNSHFLNNAGLASCHMLLVQNFISWMPFLLSAIRNTLWASVFTRTT